MYKDKKLILAFIMLIPLVLCATLYVDDDWSNGNCGGHTWGEDAFAVIQNAIDYAETNELNEEIILVYEGVYEENIEFEGDYSLSLVSEIVNGEYLNETTILQGSTGGGDLIRISRESTDTRYISIAGFTIAHSVGESGRGINIITETNNSDLSVTIEHCIITDNEIDYGDGGGIQISATTGIPEGNITIDNCIITDNSSLNGGGISIYYSKDNISLTDCIISENSAIYDENANLGGTGGGIRIKNLFIDQTNNDNALNIQNCNFLSNTCDRNGGGLSVASIFTEVEIYNCNFQDNLSAYAGGMYIYSSGSFNYPERVTIDECSFTSNMAETLCQDPNWGSNSGGGITAVDSRFCILNSDFYHNQTRGDGGGIALDSSKLIMQNSNFTENFAGGSGGGLVFKSKTGFDGCITEMENVEITGNIAGYEPYLGSGNGGGIGTKIYSYIQEFHGNNLTVSGNQSLGQGSGGGGIFLHGTTAYALVEISDSYICDNFTEKYGGGLHISSINTVELENLEVNDNIVRCITNNSLTDDYNGIGLYLSAIGEDNSGSCSINNCQFNNNYLTLLGTNTPVNAYGGGVYVGYTYLVMEDCEIMNNSNYWGSGIAFGAYDDYLDSATISNTIISGNIMHQNSPGPSGAVNIIDGYESMQSVDFINCTIVDNETDENGVGGIELDGNNVNGGGVYLENCILWGNAGDQYNDLITHITYSDLEVDNVTGLGNINLDPEFVDANNDDYHLSWNSPCIDAGDPDNDGDFENWVFDEDDQDADGSRLSIGCYPYEDQDRWEYDDGDIVWMSFPKLHCVGVNNGDQNLGSDVFGRFEETTIPDSIFVWREREIGLSPSFNGIYNDISGEYGWSPQNYNFNSTDGLKIRIADSDTTDNPVNPLIVGGLSCELNTPLTVTTGAGDLNWVGYFVPYKMNVFDAFYESTLDSLTAIKTHDWSLYKIKDEWFGACPPSGFTLYYGDMLELITNASSDFSFYWRTFGTSGGDYERLETQYFSYEEELDYQSIFVELGEEKPDEIAVYIDGVCKGAEVVDVDSLLEIRAYIMEEPQGQEIEIVTASGRSAHTAVDYMGVDAEGNKHAGSIFTDRNKMYQIVSLETSEEVPEPEKVLTCYPNPFNPELTIVYLTTEHRNLSASGGYTEINIYNVKGQKVRTLVNANMPTGEHSVVWQGRNDSGEQVCSGVYFIRMQVGHNVYTEKAVLMK